ncbi:hypothetical protein BUALT_Bualt01G0138200 [Buddleja alternifolia]|uniref:Uncharacterized protein n=1 Tax=Buddleja alternifolia TaxID=168488 RepID=A0AAV6YDY6_9LAMI|nr:hypothetical protein BUALT_Bualt01G0138200 [Buddleja alternifolia]
MVTEVTKASFLKAISKSRAPNVMLCASDSIRRQSDDGKNLSSSCLRTQVFIGSCILTLSLKPKNYDAQVDEAESTLKEALSLNYEEARALLGRLEYQRGNFDAALQVFQGIDIRMLSPRMSKAIADTTRPRKLRSRRPGVLPGVMSLHSVSLLLEAILLKSKSLAQLGRVKEAAKECKVVLDTVESALPSGIHGEINEDSKLLEMFHRALELLPKLWIQSGSVDEAIAAYRRALVKPWKLDPQRLAKVQKDLAATLLYGGVETNIPYPLEESILLLFILMQKVLYGEIEWDQEIMDHLTFALTISGQFQYLANHVEQVLPGIYNRAERWYFLALCYTVAGEDQTAINLLKKVSGFSEAKNKPHLAAFLLGAKLCAQDPSKSSEGIKFARRVIDICIDQNEHILRQAHKFLGVCYGNAARMSVSDFERISLHRDSLDSLNFASLTDRGDLEINFHLGLENAIQRNLAPAFDETMVYSKMIGGSSARGWKLLALIASAEQRLKDAEAIIDLALDETGSLDQLELLRLKAVIQIAQEQPKQAIETYRILLAFVQGFSEHHKKNKDEVLPERKLELESWLDLAKLYCDRKAYLDSDICINKAKATKFYSPRAWHATGRLFEAQAQYKEAIVAYSVSLSIEPDYVPSMVSTAQVLIKMTTRPSFPIAKSLLMSSLRLEPTNHDAWFNLGLIYKMEGSMQQAADSFQAAHELKLSAPVHSFL